MAKKKAKVKARKGQIHQLRNDHPNILPLLGALLIVLVIYFYVVGSM